MRDHTRLKVFGLADQLVLEIYRVSRDFPDTERYALTAQVRRAAISVAANIVEGCARSSHSEYLRFLEIAYGSARELQYEVSLCERLGYLSCTASASLHHECTDTAKALNGLLRSLRAKR